ncbi:MAG: LLM class flavin-dependent oxidoreductase [Propionibacterium sp.]|nr:LLM class flavin-dependent oxidoreductase [Propionibacterium sp.]
MLDLVSVSSDQPVHEAIEASMDAAERVDGLGYERLWYAEHHNTAAVASSATALLIGQAAARTKTIKVGSGGIMLPNHSPLNVVENFGTLAQMYPGRIELGLGRAPGTDPVTAQALSRSGAEPQDFMTNIRLMQTWFDAGQVGGIEVGVAQGTKVPIWMLGSSTAGAQMAAILGLPYSFASHFAPDMMEQAIAIYRANFDPDAPTAQISEPYVQVGVNVLAHEEPGKAEHYFTTTQKMFMSMRRTGGRLPLQPPGDFDPDISQMEFDMMERMLRVRAIGTPDVVARTLAEIEEATGADEIITCTYAHDPEIRTRSLELVADACGLAA